jgi:SAM-dependent methyltransferase
MSDLDRLRGEYAARARRVALGQRYSLFNQANLFAIQQRQRALANALQKEELIPLDGKAVLEVGCGSGGVLLELLSLGAKAACISGVDLLPDRLAVAQARLPGLALQNADGRHLPYLAQTFDLLLQFTVFSSILDSAIWQAMAQEMLRVLRPNGAIVWYDFWLNPTNPHTRSIRPSEICALFPGCRIRFARVTLAPPLARRLVPFSWTLALLLEKLRFLNTHYLAIIRP